MTEKTRFSNSDPLCKHAKKARTGRSSVEAACQQREYESKPNGLRQVVNLNTINPKIWTTDPSEKQKTFNGD